MLWASYGKFAQDGVSGMLNKLRVSDSGSFGVHQCPWTLIADSPLRLIWVLGMKRQRIIPLFSFRFILPMIARETASPSWQHWEA